MEMNQMKAYIHVDVSSVVYTHRPLKISSTGLGGS